MVRITLYHQNTPITRHPVPGNSFSIGSDLENDLVLAGNAFREQHLTIFRDEQGCWQAQRWDTPDAPPCWCQTDARIALGDFAIQLEIENDNALIDIPERNTPPAELNWAGTSALIRLLMNEIRIVAPLGAPVLVTGETGTGKELVARGIHDLSNRCDGPFVSVNCGCLTDSLLEDTFFGHEKGSFTGARHTARGVFEQAHRGTLLLDEIGELSMLHQAALLRVLEDRTVRRIGGEQAVPVDFRLVAATNRNLEELIKKGHFRSDLYHRISTLTLETTPLRERSDDIVPIACHFLEEMTEELGRKELSTEASERLLTYSWPGNVRELRNVLYRAAALACHDTLRGFDLAIPVEVSKPSTFKLHNVPVNRLERFVDSFDGNISRAAKALGVARTTLRDRINRTDESLLDVQVEMAG
jgi:DNA-binding NtrC family response regulator